MLAPLRLYTFLRIRAPRDPHSIPICPIRSCLRQKDWAVFNSRNSRNSRNSCSLRRGMQSICYLLWYSILSVTISNLWNLRFLHISSYFFISHCNSHCNSHCSHLALLALLALSWHSWHSWHLQAEFTHWNFTHVDEQLISASLDTDWHQKGLFRLFRAHLFHLFLSFDVPSLLCDAVRTCLCFGLPTSCCTCIPQATLFLWNPVHSCPCFLDLFSQT
jgi:hypothetical protein